MFEKYEKLKKKLFKLRWHSLSNFRYGSRVMVGNLKLKDCQEGISAFIGKRPADFEHTNDLVEEVKKN